MPSSSPPSTSPLNPPSTTAFPASPPPSPSPPIPLVLFKNPSHPTDAYHTYFSSSSSSSSTTTPTPPIYNPIFLPVLQHTLLTPALAHLRHLLTSENLNFAEKYGGVICTSQRAVEALGQVLEGVWQESEGGVHRERVQRLKLPLYTVGPATSRALSALQAQYLPLSRVKGKEAGNGGKLAEYILQQHPFSAPSAEKASESSIAKSRLPLLFLVGETRRDIIPVTLASPSLPREQRVRVDELVVYETRVVETFAQDLSLLLEAVEDKRVSQNGRIPPPIWLVIFSPAGCAEVVRALRKRNEDKGKGQRRICVATIGPTTKDVMRGEHGWDVDVCAERPSPEGVEEGIGLFMREMENRQVDGRGR